jgi:hypothetical protein
MFSFLARVIRRWRNRPGKYREAGRVDGKRGIPHVETNELPECLQQLEKFGNQEVNELAEESTKKRSALQSLRKTLFELFGADRKAHADAIRDTAERGGELDHSRRSFFAFHRRNPTYASVRPVVWVLLFIGLTVAADYPLNLASFNQLADSESVTEMMALLFTIILMMDAHTIGALFRSDNLAAKWTAWFLSLISLGFVIVLSWMRRGAIIQLASQSLTKIDPVFVFCFYLLLQLVIFTLAAIIGFSQHEPMQHDFDKKMKSVARSRQAERKAHMKVIATGQALQTAWDSECNADDIYIHRDQQLRENIEERRAIYLRANRAVRADLEDGKLPKAYGKALNLVRPQALEDAQQRINYRKKINAALMEESVS